MKKFIILPLLLLCSMLTGCKGTRPGDDVLARKPMIIYRMSIENDARGIYEYWVTDESPIGWTLRTDQKFEVGDEIVITARKPTSTHDTK